MTDETSVSARILIIDDDEAVVGMLEKTLTRAGYADVRSATDARLALPLFREFEPDLVLVDLRMPFLDGVNVMKQLRERNTEVDFLPVVFLTGDTTKEARDMALAAGANDFLLKPFDPTEVLLRIRNLLELRQRYREVQQQVDLHQRRLRETHVDMAERLAQIAEYRDGSLTSPIGTLAAGMAEELGMSEDDVELIRYAAPLHDIGMIGIPEILVKTGALSLEELDMLKTHTSLGSRVFAGSTSPILRMAEEIALYHHENWDGTGYTPGLSGESIPLPARIVAVVDTFFAMTQDRPYQEAQPINETLAWITDQSGRKFDPAVVDAFQIVHPRVDLPLLGDQDAR